MSAVRPKFGFILIVTFALLASSTYAAQKPLAAKRPVKQVAPAPEPQPAPPPPPSTLEQMPTSAPQVSFHNDQLMIVAHNSTLGDVLRAVRNQTGAAVEIPANATERVVGRFGPGPARDVLAVLLNGSHFNYVMLGSVANPNALDRVILTHKTGGSETPSPAAQGNAGQQPIASQPQGMPGMPPGVVPPGQETEEMNDDFADDTAGFEDQPTDQAVQADDQQQQPNGQPVVRTPEQLLQDLQRQQQQQQQQQQPGAPQGFPVPPGGQLRPQPPEIPPQQPQPQEQPPQ